MTPEKRYLRLKGRIFARAVHLSRRTPGILDELLSESDLAFALALNNVHRAKSSVDDFIFACVVCDMKNFARGEMRRRRWQVQACHRTLRNTPDRRRPCVLIDLSEEAKAVLRTLLDEGVSVGRSLLYATYGWRVYWRALDEIREAVLEG